MPYTYKSPRKRPRILSDSRDQSRLDSDGIDVSRWESEGGAPRMYVNSGIGDVAKLAPSPSLSGGLMMSNAARQESAHRRPHAPPMASPFLEFDLTAEIDHLRRETTWSTGRNARTLMKYDDFRVVLTALQANMRIPEHKTDGRISVHVLSGHIRLNASGRTFNLRPGSLVSLDQGSAHDIEALEESAFLLTIAWPGRTATHIGKV